ncbi:shikimate dehydrogenase [Colletotrichum incanum]|uniref:Shikimate dehydrogenase n=1 Tax=Colletotrichum incanum TaxID=1573173 RepID=A0A162NDP3_COLIC|nr:shikimate dehydrogenase [Colletotrichum incanum]
MIPKHQNACAAPIQIVSGAGGANRVAIYALHTNFKASVVYVLNTDKGKVVDLIADSQRFSPATKTIHIRKDESKGLQTPYYLISASELVVRESLKNFLLKPEKGILLDMCFKPRRTRTTSLTESLGWPAVKGTQVIGTRLSDSGSYGPEREMDATG